MLKLKHIFKRRNLKAEAEEHLTYLEEMGYSRGQVIRALDLNDQEVKRIPRWVRWFLSRWYLKIDDYYEIKVTGELVTVLSIVRTFPFMLRVAQRYYRMDERDKANEINALSEFCAATHAPKRELAKLMAIQETETGKEIVQDRLLGDLAQGQSILGKRIRGA